MTDLFKNLTSSFKNLSTSSTDRYVDRIYMVESDNNNNFKIKGPNNKKCKVILKCENIKN